MDSLEPHDQMHLEAAEGWLGLGNQIEANEGLEKINRICDARTGNPFECCVNLRGVHLPFISLKPRNDGKFEFLVNRQSAVVVAKVIR